MRKLLIASIICFVIALVSLVFLVDGWSAEIVRLDFTTENLTDSKGNLTAGALARASEATYIDSNGVLQTAAVDVPRFTADGLLIEGAGTNVIPYSEDFTQWTASNITDVLDISGPDNGVSNATTLTATAANGTIKYASIATAGAIQTFSVWMKRITGAGNIDMTVDDGGTWATKTLTTSWQRFDISGTEANTIAGIRIVVDTDAIGIFGADLKEQNYLSSYVPTDGSPVARATEAGETGVSGYSWTMGANLKNILSNALPGGAATPAIGTLVVKWKALQDYNAVDTNNRGLVSVSNASVNFTYFGGTEGQIYGWDGTNNPRLIVNWSKDDDLITVTRWDDTADGAAGYFHFSNKKNAVWDLNAGNEFAFDGVFPIGTDFWLNYTNELPIAIESITIYDTYMTIMPNIITVDTDIITVGVNTMELSIERE